MWTYLTSLQWGEILPALGVLIASLSGLAALLRLQDQKRADEDAQENAFRDDLMSRLQHTETENDRLRKERDEARELCIQMRQDLIAKLAEERSQNAAHRQRLTSVILERDKLVQDYQALQDLVRRLGFPPR